MTERPIIFSSDRVRAILAGQMTQFRTIIKNMPEKWHTGKCAFEKNGHGDEAFIIYGKCGEKTRYAPYRVGDILWVKEPHYLWGYWKKNGQTKTGRQKWKFVYRKSMGVRYPDNLPPIVCTKKDELGWFKRTGRFMPKWAARHWLRVTAVKDPQQIQNISEEDAKAEGIRSSQLPHRITIYYAGDYPNPTAAETARGAFRNLWNRLHPLPGERWEDGPWTFPCVIERFER